METVKSSEIDLTSLDDLGNKYKVGLKIGGGVEGDVFQATDTHTGKNVAIKFMDWTKDSEKRIKQEYYVYKELSAHENFPEFYGIFSNRGSDGKQRIGLVIEFCEGGAVSDFAIKMEQQNQRIIESLIAYILREALKAVTHLHDNNICHRDIRGSNILLTGDGRVKLIDFGLSCTVEGDNKLTTCLGSPSWMAPEMLPNQVQQYVEYDKKIDIWALGITAIEIGDGEPPMKDVHPGRVMFEIVKNPPPTSKRFAERSTLYNDFINECLVKDPRNRPFIQELIHHKFLELPLQEENIIKVKEELSTLIKNLDGLNYYKQPEVQVFDGLIKTESERIFKKILQEDLANLTEISEDSIFSEIYERCQGDEFQTYIGDVLLTINTNKFCNIYGNQYHKQYRFKAKSQNPPHIYAVADSAFRDVFYHEKTQHILFAGETGAGKTVNMLHAVDHLLFLGEGLNISEKIKKALMVIQSLGNAATPYNLDSTRHILQMKITFTNTRKVSGAIFNLYQLEKDRFAILDKKQANFHIFYDFYRFVMSKNNLAKLYLQEGHQYNFLKINEKTESEKDVKAYRLFEENLRDLDFEEDELLSIRKIIAAILLIGEIEFGNDDLEKTIINNKTIVEQIADLLSVESKKLAWSLVNYCLIEEGEAVMRNNSLTEAEEMKLMLAKGLYHRLVDWIINKINNKFSISRFTYGGNHIISLLDYFGFECYKKNTLNQLLVNAFNEQFQYYYYQITFSLSKEIAAQEEILYPDVPYNDNASVIKQIMSRPDGILHKIDEATRQDDVCQFLETLQNSEEFPQELINNLWEEFKIKHYTGIITYDASEMLQKNRNFLAPELIETMRLSTNQVTKQLFSSTFTKSGNLISEFNQIAKSKVTNEVGNVTVAYSQSRQMKTTTSNFRGACCNVFEDLISKDCNFHFVRCVNASLPNDPLEFDSHLVRQQLRALAIVNTVKEIREGYSYSISFKEFLDRYKFLAFDFDENVEETKENCQLFLLRLKLEGWTIGKTKVFLKYYNKEYLTRLYESQLKKIIKVQSMMRRFIARRKLICRIKNYQNVIGFFPRRQFSQDDNLETSEGQYNEDYNESSSDPSEIYSESE